MKTLDINFWGKGTLCHAQVELDGIVESWTAKASISGHSSIKELNIRYRLGDYLSPRFVDEKNLLFFDAFINELAQRATVLLPNQSEEDDNA